LLHRKQILTPFLNKELVTLGTEIKVTVLLIKGYRQTDYIFTINKFLDINVITYLIDVMLYLNYNKIPVFHLSALSNGSGNQVPEIKYTLYKSCHFFEFLVLYNLFMPRYGWNTAIVGTKH
jgi:hypothetical protein